MKNSKPSGKTPKPAPGRGQARPSEQKIPDHRKQIQQANTVTDGEDG